MKTESTFDLATASRDVLAFAVRQGDSLKTKLAPVAACVFEGDNLETMATRLETVFLACRGESLSAKQAGRKESVRSIGKAWNRLADGLRYHATTHELSLTFPNLASGEGTLRVERSTDAALRRKAEKAAREESDALALATFQADQTQAQLDALRLMSPYQLAESFAAQLNAWSDDSAQHDKVIARVVALLDGTAEPVTEPAVTEPVTE